MDRRGGRLELERALSAPAQIGDALGDRRRHPATCAGGDAGLGHPALRDALAAGGGGSDPGEAGRRKLVGTPRLNLTYTATGTSTRPDGETAIFAQLVDNERGVVVNNLATPIPILLDGQEHTIDIALERIASRTTAAGYTLQLIPQTSVYDLQRATGVVDLKSVKVSIPLTAPTEAC